MPKTVPKAMSASFPLGENEFTRRKLLASCGEVPARYSCKLFKPSPSGSQVVQEVPFVAVGDPNCVARHESDMPSPTESGPKAICVEPPPWLNLTFTNPAPS